MLTEWINLIASLFLLLAFAMLAQRRIISLLRLYIFQGLVLVLSMISVAILTGQHQLYYSAIITFFLKVLIVPIILRRLIHKLKIRLDVEALVNIPIIMLLGIGLVVVAFNIVLPISAVAGTVTQGTLGIALASVLLSALILILRRKAVTQVIGFLSLENAIMFAATSTTYGMPLIIELGIAFDVLIGTLIFGVFFLHIRTAFDSLDIKYLEKLKEE